MASLPPSNEGDLVVSYSLGSGERMDEAVVNAFLAADVDVFDRPTQLVDWIEPAVFEDLQWSSERPTHLRTRIWDHRVVLTPEEVRIYSPGRATR